MSRDLNVLLSLRRVLSAVANGRGVSSSMVAVFSADRSGLKGVARATLLGYPPEAALVPVLKHEGREAAMLASLVVDGARGSAELVGMKGEKLALSLERWIEAREGRKLEQKVLRFRGLMVSGVLGAVLGMVATVAPLVGGLQVGTVPTHVDPALVRETALAMTCLSTGMLGLFMSGRNLLLNVGVALAAFALATVAVSPLTTVTAPNLWGIK